MRSPANQWMMSRRIPYSGSDLREINKKWLFFEYDPLFSAYFCMTVPVQRFTFSIKFCTVECGQGQESRPALGPEVYGLILAFICGHAAGHPPKFGSFHNCQSIHTGDKDMGKYVAFCIVLLLPSITLALEVAPTSEQIEQAKNEGRKMAEGYGESRDAGIKALTAFISRYEFGTGGNCGAGNITTKLKNIVLSSYLKAKEGRELGEEAVKGILNEENLEVEVGSCYRMPSQLEKDRLVLKQNGKDIPPQKIEQISKLAQSGVHLNTVKAEFSLKSFDPQESCTFVLIPAIGEALEFEVNLASMP